MILSTDAEGGLLFAPGHGAIRRVIPLPYRHPSSRLTQRISSPAVLRGDSPSHLILEWRAPDNSSLLDILLPCGQHILKIFWLRLR